MKQKLLKSTISVLEALKEDANMALNGTWDCTEPGFRAQIRAINGVLSELKAKLK